MIITPELMLNTITARLQESFPNEIAYINLVPVGFQRPSNLIELAGIEMDVLSGGSNVVTLRWQVKITTFCKVDEVHDSHLPTLDLRAMTILSTFAAGYLRVGDRAPKITTCSADTSGYDFAQVKLILSLTMDCSEFCPKEIYPVAEELHTKINGKGDYEQ